MEAWHRFTSNLAKELGDDVVAKWMPKLLRFDAANLYLEPTDSFQIAWFEEHIRPRLSGFVNNNGRPVKIHLSQRIKPKGSPSPENFTIVPDSLDPELTFETFIPVKENLVAYKLLQDNPSFNPIYLYGPNGSGKTHLLTAMAHTLQKQGKKVFFVRAATFTEHVVQAIRLGQMQLFRKVYRDIDVLIVDGIDLFSRKLSTQEEFFHTFNTLHTSGRLVVLSAIAAPTQLKEVEERLTSRFEWGISLQIGKSDIAAILEKKCALWKFPLKPELLSYLLEKFPKDPILALQALAFRAPKAPLTPPIIDKLLSDLLEKESANALTSDMIVKAVAAHYGLTSEDLLGKSQTREIALPRQIAMYYCRSKLKMAYQKIGELFDRDHSTVMSSVKLTEKGLSEHKIANIL